MDILQYKRTRVGFGFCIVIMAMICTAGPLFMTILVPLDICNRDLYQYDATITKCVNGTSTTASSIVTCDGKTISYSYRPVLKIVTPVTITTLSNTWCSVNVTKCPLDHLGYMNRRQKWTITPGEECTPLAVIGLCFANIVATTFILMLFSVGFYLLFRETPVKVRAVSPTDDFAT